MTRLIVVALSAVGLILFVTFVAARLVRSRLRGISIRMQVFVALALIVGAFAFGLGVLVVDRVEARAVRLAQATAHDEAEAVAAILQSEMERTGVPFSVMAVQLGRSLRPTARPAQARKERGWDLETTGLELLDEQSVVLYPPGTQSRARDAGALVVDAPLIQNGRTLGTVRVVKPVIVVQALLADFAPTVLVISLLLGAVAAFAAAWIGRAIAAPLEALSDYAERVSQGERSQLPKRVSGREVLRLVQSIGTLQRKLEGRPFVETFAADLSHELKNPVAAIRASAEVLEDGALEDAPQARHFVGRIREAAGRIEKLLAELLHLAQVETRGAENLARVELNELSERVLAALENDRERVTIHAARGALWVRGDREWLTRAVKNLIDNALVHSPPGSPVAVELRAESDDVLLRTENEGAIPEHARANLFRRFVTTRRERGGTGLGLAIVRAVAEAHGGQVELLSSGPAQVVVELRLPRA